MRDSRNRAVRKSGDLSGGARAWGIDDNGIGLAQLFRQDRVSKEIAHLRTHRLETLRVPLSIEQCVGHGL